MGSLLLLLLVVVVYCLAEDHHPRLLKRERETQRLGSNGRPLGQHMAPMCASLCAPSLLLFIHLQREPELSSVSTSATLRSLNFGHFGGKMMRNSPGV